MATTAELTQESTSRDIQAGKYRTHFNEAGTGEHTAILLHGGGLGATGWSNFFKNIGPLSEQLRVILLDQVGYGGTDDEVFKDEPSSTVRARNVKDVMDALDIKKATLVGNSMGGSTALTFAVDYPERVEKLVLMGSVAAGVNLFAQSPTDGQKALRDMAQSPSAENLKNLFRLMLYDSSSVSDQVLEQRFAGIMANPGHWEAAKKSVNVPRDLSADYTNIKAPTLIMHGRQDRVVTLEGSMRLLTALSNSRLVVFNECGHWAQYEQADVFNRYVADFILNG